MADERSNTVPAINQLASDARIRGEGDGAPRILFLGNSITLHAPKAEIGWHGDWGMAASAPENDYVRVFMRRIREKCPNAAWRVGQLVDWERNFWLDEAMLSDFSSLRDWQPDVICYVILGANTPDETLDQHDYCEHYRKMVRYFDPENRAKRIVTTMFWENPRKDAAIRRAAAAEGAQLVELGDLGSNDAMMAIGLFEHRGVAIHPGDAGMAEIAARLLDSAII